MMMMMMMLIIHNKNMYILNTSVTAKAPFELQMF
jgi:hypothetical protein